MSALIPSLTPETFLIHKLAEGLFPSTMYKPLCNTRTCEKRRDMLREIAKGSVEVDESIDQVIATGNTNKDGNYKKNSKKKSSIKSNLGTSMTGKLSKSIVPSNQISSEKRVSTVPSSSLSEIPTAGSSIAVNSLAFVTSPHISSQTAVATGANVSYSSNQTPSHESILNLQEEVSSLKEIIKQLASSLGIII